MDKEQLTRNLLMLESTRSRSENGRLFKSSVPERQCFVDQRAWPPSVRVDPHKRANCLRCTQSQPEDWGPTLGRVAATNTQSRSLLIAVHFFAMTIHLF